GHRNTIFSKSCGTRGQFGNAASTHTPAPASGFPVSSSRTTPWIVGPSSAAGGASSSGLAVGSSIGFAEPGRGDAAPARSGASPPSSYDELHGPHEDPARAPVPDARGGRGARG